MISVGIESINVFTGSSSVDVGMLAKHRELDIPRFENLMMLEKTVVLPFEDPVTFGVNAAKPILDQLSEQEKSKIELLITCTESGIDFGKSISNYIHDMLGLKRNCRMFELKQACYSGTAGFQMAIDFILSQRSPGAKALVITTDISRFTKTKGGNIIRDDWSFVEPSTGAGAVAMLIGEDPRVFEIDHGANGYYGYEVMDTCRPVPNSEAGDSDLSLMTYLDCCENSYREYESRVSGSDYRSTFNYLAFHTPFGGMVKGAHRMMMRKFLRATPTEIEEDFERRVLPGINYCQRVGNIMGGTIFLSLLSTIENANFEAPTRIGCFSYGSGCCSEFYSGIVMESAKSEIKKLKISEQLANRYELSIEEYEHILVTNDQVKFGVKDADINANMSPCEPRSLIHGPALVLDRIENYHRKYEWV